MLEKNFSIKNIGVSLYNPKDLFKVIKVRIPDAIQVPINIFDKRFLDKKVIDCLKKNNIKMHARSIFLQGLLFMDKKEIYKRFINVSKIYEKILKISHKEKLDLSYLSLVWVYNKKEIDKVVLGVNSLKQLKLNLKYVKNKISNKSIKLIDEINLHKNKITKPYLWDKKKLKIMKSIIVIGAGLTGCLTAYKIAKKYPKKIYLIDASKKFLEDSTLLISQIIESIMGIMELMLIGILIYLDFFKKR